jgi:hypothetical protein
MHAKSPQTHFILLDLSTLITCYIYKTSKQIKINF